MTISLTGSVALGSFSLDIELGIEPGGVVAVVGPNGSGKSTFLRTIAGLQPLDRGRLMIDDVVVDDAERRVLVAPRSRSVGLVFQKGRLFDNLDTLDNVAFGLRARGVRRVEAECRARAIMTRLDIDDLARLRPAQLSGGQAQRVEIARAIVGEPRTLLLDEPTSALDVGAKDLFRTMLRDVLRDHQGHRVLVTHDHDDVVALADRVVVFRTGHVVWDGRVDDDGWRNA